MDPLGRIGLFRSVFLPRVRLRIMNSVDVILDTLVVDYFFSLSLAIIINNIERHSVSSLTVVSN